MDIKFSTNCKCKASLLYYRVLVRVLKEADLFYNNGFNDHI